MLHLSSSCRYFYFNGIVDMRKGSYSLAALVSQEMQQNVLSGDVYVFVSKKRSKIKLLQWDADGYALFEKRLEQGTFEKPITNDNGHYNISAQQLQHILQGVVLKSIKHRKRFTVADSMA